MRIHPQAAGGVAQRHHPKARNPLTLPQAPRPRPRAPKPTTAQPRPETKTAEPQPHPARRRQPATARSPTPTAQTAPNRRPTRTPPKPERNITHRGSPPRNHRATGARGTRPPHPQQASSEEARGRRSGRPAPPRATERPARRTRTHSKKVGGEPRARPRVTAPSLTLALRFEGGPLEVPVLGGEQLRELPQGPRARLHRQVAGRVDRREPLLEGVDRFERVAG